MRSSIRVQQTSNFLISVMKEFDECDDDVKQLLLMSLVLHVADELVSSDSVIEIMLTIIVTDTMKFSAALTKTYSRIQFIKKYLS